MLGYWLQAEGLGADVGASISQLPSVGVVDRSVEGLAAYKVIIAALRVSVLPGGFGRVS